MINKELLKAIKENILSNVIMNKCKTGIFEIIDKDTFCVNNNDNRYALYLNDEYTVNDERIKIHGNAKLNILKSFVENYNYNDIRKEYELKIEMLEQQKTFEENNKYRLENLKIKIDKILEKYIKDSKIIYCYGINKYEFSFKCQITKYNHEYFKIKLNGKNFEVYNDNWIIASEDDILKSLNIAAYENYYNELKEIERLEKIKNDNEATIINLYDSIGDKTLIIKSGKNTFTCFTQYQKYSTGTGKSGKFYNCNICNYIDFMNKKKIGKLQYCLLDKDIKSYGNNEYLNSFDWKNII